MEQVLAALVDEAGIFFLSRLKRSGDPALEHLGEAEDGIQRRAQLVAHIGEKLRLGQVGGLGRGFGLAQAALGENFFGDVTGRPAIAQKPSRRVEERFAADRDDVLRLDPDLPGVDEIAKGFVPVQDCTVFAPFDWLARSIGGEIDAGPPGPGLRILTKGADIIGLIDKAMLLVGLPQPIRRGQREITKPRFAVAQSGFRTLQRAGAGDQRSEKQGETCDRAQCADGDESRLAAPAGEHRVLRHCHGHDEGQIAQRMDRDDARHPIQISR